MAIVKKIVVSAGRTFNHPYESYSNLRPQVTVEAQLEEGEDFREATKSLQAQAEQLVEDHKRFMLDSLHELHTLGENQRRAASIEATIRRSQKELDELRKEFPGLQLPPKSSEDEDEEEEVTF